MLDGSSRATLLLDVSGTTQQGAEVDEKAVPFASVDISGAEFGDGTVLLFDRAERGYLVTQTWALRLLDRADGRSTVQRLACEGNVPTPSAIEFFRGAELAGMLNLSGSLIGGLR